MTFRSRPPDRGRMDSVRRGYAFPAGEAGRWKDEGIKGRGVSQRREAGDLLELRG